jgi:hypothetical protein
MANLAASTKIHIYEVNVGLVEVQPHSNAPFLPKVAVFARREGKFLLGRGFRVPIFIAMPLQPKTLTGGGDGTHKETKADEGETFLKH